MKRIVCAALFAAAVAGVSSGCGSAPASEGEQSQSSDLSPAFNYCWFVHAPSSGADPASVCDGASLSDLTQLPRGLANAGCTSMGTYQLGRGNKPARYAICPVQYGWCKTGTGFAPCPYNLAAVAFTHAYNRPDDAAPFLQYGYAKLSASECDACIGPAPSGMQFVVWHDAATCQGTNGDAHTHDLNISSALGIPPDDAMNQCKNYPYSGCTGGCMNPARPPGL